MEWRPVLIVIGAVITIDRVPGRRPAPCAADVAEGRRKAGGRCLKILRETVKVAIDARDDGAPRPWPTYRNVFEMWIEAEPPGGKGMGAMTDDDRDDEDDDRDEDDDDEDDDEDVLRC